MGDAAAPRRARAIGDFAFSVFAAGLGLALLLATGRHLFASPYAGAPQAAATLVAPASRGVSAAAIVVALPKPVTDAARRPIAAAKIAARPSSRVSSGRGRALLPASVHRSAKPVARADGTSRAAQARPQAALLRNRPSALGTRFVLRHVQAVGVKHPSRVRRAAAGKASPRQTAIHVAVRAKSLAAGGNVVARSSVPSRAASRDHVVRRPFGVSGARAAGARAAGARAARARTARARAVIEPPLGYDAQPALVVAPDAEQLDLGDFALPGIRSRRRH